MADAATFCPGLVRSELAAVVHDIADSSRGSYRTVISEINRRREELDHVEFKHEYMEANWEAHDLAKGSVVLGTGHHLWLVQGILGATTGFCKHPYYDPIIKSGVLA